MLTMTFGCAYNGDKAKHLIIDGLSVPVRFDSFFMSDYVGGAENKRGFVRIISLVLCRVFSPRHLTDSGFLNKGHRKMNNIITFHDKKLTVKDINGHIWLSAPDISAALGYKNADQVGKIYNRYKDEFTSDMSQTVELTVSGNLTKKVRVFSSRGCHLIAMFSKTPVAKEFRKWVLDVLDKLNTPQQPDLIPVSSYTRRLPSAPREIVLSEKARSEIGGIVKKCCAVAIKDALKELVSVLDKNAPQISVFDERFEPAEREAYNAILAYGKHMKDKGMTIGVLEAKDYILSGRYEKERKKWEKINF